MKNLKRVRVRTLIIIAAIVVVVVIFVVMKMNTLAENTPQNNETTMVQFINVEATAIELRDIMGEESIFPQLYEGYEQYQQTGLPKGEAFAKAQEDMIERKSMYQAAVENGFSVTDVEVNTYIDQLLAEMKKGTDYSKVESVFAKTNITLEDTYRKNFTFYKEGLAIKNYTDNEYSQMQANEATTDPDAYSKKFNELQKNAIASYKKTPDYNKLIKQINEMKPTIMNSDNIIEAAKKYVESGTSN